MYKIIEKSINLQAQFLRAWVAKKNNFLISITCKNKIKISDNDHRNSESLKQQKLVKMSLKIVQRRNNITNAFGVEQ